MSSEHASEQLQRVLTFLRESERLKDTLRTAWTTLGRRESTAEHSWRLALLALALEEELEGLDTARVLQLAVVHDLGEVFTGDVSAAAETDPAGKERREREGVAEITGLLPGETGRRIAELWDEYTRGATAEAKAVKALDKIETIVQHNQGDNPPDFDYRFNLGYGRGHAEAHRALQRLRALVDGETARRAGEEQGREQNPSSPGN